MIVFSFSEESLTIVIVKRLENGRFVFTVEPLETRRRCLSSALGFRQIQGATL